VTVIAYHLVWTNYGTWLANDPRGSGSHSVYTPELAGLGAVHYGRKRVQLWRSEVREFYAEAEELLSSPVIRFDAEQRDAIGESFAESVRKFKYTCYACAVMPDHVHLVVRKHRDDAEQMIGNFQGVSRSWLVKHELVPEEHPVWTKGGWRVFLNAPEEVWLRIRYVEGNPGRDCRVRCGRLWWRTITGRGINGRAKPQATKCAGWRMLALDEVELRPAGRILVERECGTGGEGLHS
jgi:REP-associated tyrosine transposase